MIAGLSILDQVLLGAVLVAAVVGLVRGLSGELGSMVGFAAALVAGYFLYRPAEWAAAAVGLSSEGVRPIAAGVLDFLLALVVFGLARGGVRRFVSCCLGGVTDAVLGALAGGFKGLVLAGALAGVATGTGLVSQRTVAGSVALAHSSVVRALAGLAGAYVAGARGE